MESSEEIRRVVERWTRAVAEGDHEAALGRLSAHAGTLIIGNDPREWWHGDAARAIWQRQLEELGAFPVSVHEIEAWEEGTVGWASCKETITSAEISFDARATYVLHLEHGEWKIVQIHWSLPKPNEEFLGRALTTSLDELERTLQLEQPDLSAVLAADGTVTIVFTDIVDSTLLLARLGDHAWLPVLRQHHAVIQEVTSAHDGTVVERQGDGSMLAFSSARRAVSCAKSIQQHVEQFTDGTPPLRVRIGIHTGDALREADQFFGTTVHYAARVASHALGGEILVSRVVRDLVAGRPDLTFLEEREVQLKGIEGLHRLFPVELTSAHTSA
jgi:class 3 adenylate cyclase